MSQCAEKLPADSEFDALLRAYDSHIEQSRDIQWA